MGLVIEQQPGTRNPLQAHCPLAAPSNPLQPLTAP